MSNKFSANLSKNFPSATTLDKAEFGTEYTITSCNLPQRLQSRFAELGFVAGTKVELIKKAPLGDPIEIRILGYLLCIRLNEAKHITIERVQP